LLHSQAQCASVNPKLVTSILRTFLLRVVNMSWKIVNSLSHPVGRNEMTTGPPGTIWMLSRTWKLLKFSTNRRLLLTDCPKKASSTFYGVMGHGKNFYTSAVHSVGHLLLAVALCIEL